MGVSVNAQHNNRELLLVDATITGKGVADMCRLADTTSYYFVTVSITNTQDTAVQLWFMSCSWPMDSFSINNDSVVYRFCFSGCDHNVPDFILLPPQKTARFYGTIRSYKKDGSVPRVKVGFRYYNSFNNIFYTGPEGYRKHPCQLFWSNEIELKDNLYGYDIKK